MTRASDDLELLHGIYDAELSYVWSSLRRLGVPPRDLEDVAHEVFMVVHRRWADYDRARPIRPWLFGIAFRAASKYRRHSSHSREQLSDPAEPASETNLEEALLEKDARAFVARALESVEIERRAVFVMHDIDGVAVPEIAGVLSIPLNTAYSRLRLARQDFAAAVHRLKQADRALRTPPGANV